jgi:hypothetical protein
MPDTSPVSRRRVSSGSLARAVALVAIGVIVGLSFSLRSGSSAAARGDVRDDAPEPARCVAPPAVPVRARAAPAPPRHEAAARAQAPSAENALLHTQATSRDLANRLRKRTSLAEHMLPGRDPQEVMSEVLPYMQGMADAVAQVGPEYVEDFAAEIEQSLCDTDSSDALQLVMLRLAATIPDFGTSRGYDCVFARADTSPPLLNTAIEAWRASGLPKSEALDQLAQSNPDHRLRIEGAQQRMRLQASNLMTEETERNNP